MSGSDFNPAISVLMPAYNAEKYITLAIESVLGQTFKDFEFVIVDDSSTDNTWPIIQKFAEKDKRIVPVRNKENLKIAKTLNAGIKLAKGKYIARMDADDWSYPDRLEKQHHFMEEHPEVGIMGGTMVIINEVGKVVGERRYYTQDDEIRKNIFKFSPFCHPVVMIRKSVLEKSGLYDPRYKSSEDYELYFRIGRHAKFANLEDKLTKYRTLPGSLTTGRLKRVELTTIEIRKKNFDSDTYQATKVDKIYNLLHLISVHAPIIPPKQKIRLFSFIRGFVRPRS